MSSSVSAERNKLDEGKTFEVLLERYAKRSHDQLMGRTPQNKAVVITRGNHRPGERVMVRITDSSSATLMGEVVGEE